MIPISLSITGFGPTGPYSERPAYDPIAQGLVGTGCRMFGAVRVTRRRSAGSR